MSEPQPEEIRDRIMAELEHNVSLFEQLWQNIRGGNASKLPDPKAFDAFASTPTPLWSFSVYDNQEENLPDTFVREDIRRIRSIYRHLRSLANLRSEFSEATELYRKQMQGQVDRTRQGTAGDWSAWKEDSKRFNQEYGQRREDLWNKLRDAHREIMEAWSTLKEHASP